MRTLGFLVLLLLALLLTYFQITWLGIICAIAAVIVLLAGFGKVGAKGIKAVGSGIKTDLAEEYKVFEKHEPKPIDTSAFADIAKGVGEKLGEAAAEDKGESLRWTSRKSWERAEKGTKSMLELFRKFFQK